MDFIKCPGCGAKLYYNKYYENTYSNVLPSKRYIKLQDNLISAESQDYTSKNYKYVI